jgi:hypothetical protein
MKKMDIHISAERIGRDCIGQVLALGFGIDRFENCINSKPPTFHATYIGSKQLPDDALWTKLIETLSSDGEFSGIAEEEQRVVSTVFDADTVHLRGVHLPKLAIGECPADVHKACDVHIRSHLDATSPEVIGALQSLGTASFDRTRGDIRTRVFTATFVSLEDGRNFYDAITDWLAQMQGFSGQVKLERMLRFVRRPSTALTLPITTHAALKKWLENLSNQKGAGGAYAKGTSEGISSVV